MNTDEFYYNQEQDTPAPSSSAPGAPAADHTTGYSTPDPYRMQSSYTPVTGYAANPYAQPVTDWQPRAKKAKKSSRAPFVLAVIALSLVCGFLGATLANMIPIRTTNTAGENKVLYQAVDSGNENGSAGTTGMSFSSVAASVQNSVVEITTETVSTSAFLQQYVSTGAGSGVVITEDGYIVTNNHVIDGASTISVRLINGNSYPATLIGTDSKTDIAVIKIEVDGLQAAVFGDSDKLVVGESVLAVGNPLGELGGTVTSGIISALDRAITVEGENMQLLQTDTAINPGNSGGGLFNAAGQLIGVVNAKSSGSGIEGLGFAIPINTAKTVIEELLAYGYVTGRVDTGMTFLDITDTQTAFSYRVSRLGVYVSSVASGSNAQQAGITAGDCIVAVDGVEISTSAELRSILDGHQVGDSITLTIYRNGRTADIALTLSEYQPN